MKISWLISICLIVAGNFLWAQNAPVTTAATINNAIPGQDVTVPVTVTGFNNIGSITLTLDYDYSKVHFVSGNQNPLLSGNFIVGDNDLGTGMHRIILDWYGSGISLPDGTWIVNYTFTYLTGTASLQWYEMGPSCEYTDANSNVLPDSPSSAYYINGLICGIVPTPGPITGSSPVCQGQGSIQYSIFPLANVTGYLWTVPQGVSITGGNNTNSITVDFSTAAVSGNISVNGENDCGNGPSAIFPVVVNNLPVANAGNDTTIPCGGSLMLHAASGGTGSFVYHWSPENLLVNPNVQNPQTIQLTSTTIFHLVVTNQGSFCTDDDNVSVTISGGVLSINPSAVPGQICRNSVAQLYANAGGGTGNYSYSWTSVPAGNPTWSSNLANPLVSSDSSSIYYLTVSDGFSTSSGSTNLEVDQLPAAAISGGDSLCDNGSMATLRIDLSGVPPWTFTYSNGVTSVTINNQLTSPYLIETSDPGSYTILSVHNASCYGTASGVASVLVFPVPPAPVIIQSGTALISNAPHGNQWYRDMEAIQGATDQSYSPTENGEYYDMVTMNGCSSDSSNHIDVIIISAPEIHQSGEFQLFPNPAKDYFFIKIPGPPREIVSVKIFSSYGRFLEKYEIAGGPFFNAYRIDAGSLSAGIYFLLIDTGNETIIQKLVIL